MQRDNPKVYVLKNEEREKAQLRGYLYSEAMKEKNA